MHVQCRLHDRPLRVELDHHTVGVFPEATWRSALEDAGLEVVDPGVEDPYADERATFVGRRRA